MAEEQLNRQAIALQAQVGSDTPRIAIAALSYIPRAPTKVWVRLTILVPDTRRVAVVEKEHFGGECLSVGCIPSKALLRSARAGQLPSPTKLINQVATL